MPVLSFTKMQGTGNDFVVLDRTGACEPLPWERLAPVLCDRHYGIGADGLLIVEDSEAADFRMRVINADGSEPEMCGNGLRCFAVYLFTQELVDSPRFRVETGAGVLDVTLVLDSKGLAVAVRVDMGAPRLARTAIPMLGDEADQVVEEWLQMGDRVFSVTCVSMGNPHCVTFLDALDPEVFATYGPQIEGHAAFPRRANAEFAQVLASDRIRVQVFERGVGPTLACGTGACATLVAGVLTGRTERKGTVELPGGALEIEWAPDGHVYMTGPASVVFTGTVDLDALVPSEPASI